ncbi:MAG: DNA repair exonuclease [Clostridia bacterium]|nr:DNA repair exonuclease [Clostridia bacterium]
MTKKIIHCADVHFDSVMSGIKDSKKVNIRREDMRKTFQKIIALAMDSDILLISGDLFDAKKVSKSTLEFIKGEFLKIPEVAVFIVAGNHDYLGETSVYKTFDFGKNVHIFGTQMECVELADCDVYGISFKTPNDEREMLSGFSVKNPDKINICLMHANLSGNDYNPIKISDIEKSGLDYLALGHIHKASEIKKANSTYYAYCGCPEGRGNDETGEKGVYKIELIKGNILASEFIPVATRMYIDEEIDISGTGNYDEIIERILTKYKGEKHLYRFTLTGSCDFFIDTEVIEEKIEAFSLTVRDKTTPSVDLCELAKEFSLKGLFVRFALENKNNLTEEEFNDAIKSGLYYIEKEENNEN